MSVIGVDDARVTRSPANRRRLCGIALCSAPPGLLAVVKAGGVNLRNRSRSERLAIERFEHRVERTPECRFPHDHLQRKRREVILERLHATIDLGILGSGSDQLAFRHCLAEMIADYSEARGPVVLKQAKEQSDCSVLIDRLRMDVIAATHDLPSLLRSSIHRVTGEDQTQLYCMDERIERSGNRLVTLGLYVAASLLRERASALVSSGSSHCRRRCSMPPRCGSLGA